MYYIAVPPDSVAWSCVLCAGHDFLVGSIGVFCCNASFTCLLRTVSVARVYVRCALFHRIDAQTAFRGRVMACWCDALAMALGMCVHMRTCAGVQVLPVVGFASAHMLRTVHFAKLRATPCDLRFARHCLQSD